MTDNKVSIRPLIKNIGSIENKSEEEKFQNVTLRPIIKLQHDLLLAFFQNYLLRKKIVFLDQSTLKKSELLDKIFKNDSLFKAELRGLIIGHFTPDEYEIYLSISVETNKRILAISKERLHSVYCREEGISVGK